MDSRSVSHIASSFCFTRRRAMAMGLGICAASPVAAQSLSWNRRQEFENRFEGQLNVPYARAGLALLSFTKGHVQFQPGAGVELGVTFYLPLDIPVKLVAQELNPSFFYMMEAKPRKWSVGRRNVFAPWETSPVLAPLKLDGSKIGVLIRLGDQSDLRLAPAFVSVLRPGAASKQDAGDYVLQLSPGRSIAQCGWRLATEGGQQVTAGEVGSHVEGEPFAIQIPTAGLPTGQMRLTVLARWRSSVESITREYLFYHESSI